MARKTYKKKATAKKARRKGQPVYKVKGGWRIGKKKRRVKRRKRKRKRRGNPGGWPCEE